MVNLQIIEQIDLLSNLTDSILLSFATPNNSYKIDGIVGGRGQERGIVQVLKGLQLLISNGVEISKEQKDKINHLCHKLQEIYERNKMAKEGIKPTPTIHTIGNFTIKTPHWEIQHPTTALLERYLYPIEELQKAMQANEPVAKISAEEQKYNTTREEIESVYEELEEQKLIKREEDYFVWLGRPIELDFLLGVLLCNDKVYSDKYNEVHWDICGDMPHMAVQKLFPNSKYIDQQRRNKKSKNFDDSAKPPKGWETIYNIVKGA